jgi:hypothetical protein
LRDEKDPTITCAFEGGDPRFGSLAAQWAAMRIGLVQKHDVRRPALRLRRTMRSAFSSLPCSPPGTGSLLVSVRFSDHGRFPIVVRFLVIILIVIIDIIVVGGGTIVRVPGPGASSAAGTRPTCRRRARMPPPGTIMCTCGWWVSAEPQLCSTERKPMRTPR